MVSSDAFEHLVTNFTEFFGDGGSFETIATARNRAAYLLDSAINPGTAEAKQVDEALEAALVRTARQIVQQGKAPLETYQELVELYERQPTLGVRSSTSVLQQAYSTPLPIAYLAATLANIESQHSVYEPSAGHGALLLRANPINVTVNEINPDRAADLRAQGYTVSEWDAATYQPDRLHDVVIMNPPFGTVADQTGQRKRFQNGRYSTTQIDHAIALHKPETTPETTLELPPEQNRHRPNSTFNLIFGDV